MKTTISISGMSCQHCVGSVTEALKKLDGVSEAVVNLEAKSAGIDYDETKVNLSDFKKAIEDAGFKVE